MLKNVSRIVLSMAVVMFVFTSCSDQEIEPITEENVAFSSNGCPVWDSQDVFTEAEITAPNRKFKIFTINGTTSEAAVNGTFQLGLLVKENSQQLGAVYLKVSETEWRKLNDCRGSNIAGFWSTLGKNDSKDAKIIQQGTNSNAVYLFFGNNGRQFKKFRVDMGEVLKEHNQPIRTLPGGFSAGSLFYHDSNRADFPANWLGVKGKRVWNFGSNLNSTPSLMRIRANGFTGADLNKDIRRIKGYWPFNNQRIVIERTMGKSDITVQKDRKNGVNFYKD